MTDIDCDRVANIARLANIDEDTALLWIDADWPEGQGHIEWVHESSDEEIADWLACCLDSLRPNPQWVTDYLASLPPQPKGDDDDDDD